jgi:hypothetical protein
MTVDIVSLIAGFALILNGPRAIYNLLLVNHHWHDCILDTPLLFDNVVIHASKSLSSLSYLFSLSKQVTLQVIFALNFRCSYSVIYEVALLISRHSRRIRYIRCECYNWRPVARALQPFGHVQWPLIEEVVVKGFGIERGIYLLSFARWDLKLFFDWVEHTPRNHKLYRTILKVVGAEDDQRLTNRTDTLDITPPIASHVSTSVLSHTWDALLNSGDLRVLHFSCLSNVVLVPFIERLAVKPYKFLTTLTIHARFYHTLPPSQSVWLRLARNSPAVMQITLPEADDSFLELLEKDCSVWPAITCFAFMRGPQQLDGLHKMLTSRSTSGTPVQRVTIHNRNRNWCEGQLSELRGLADVRVLAT